MKERVEITREPIDVAEATAAVGDPSGGATVVFLGTTRDHNDGRRVISLEYEAYREMALSEMRKLVREAARRWNILAAAVIHRVGEVRIGEASVVVAVSAAHRDEAFSAARFLIDRLKEVVPIWKKEHYEGGELWIGSQQGERFPAGRETPPCNSASPAVTDAVSNRR